MPNDDEIDLQACVSALEELQNEPEDVEFPTAYKKHLILLQSIKTVLSNKVEVSPSDANKVLTICPWYTTDVRCVQHVFSIISELIDIVKDDPHVDFLPFALALLEFLNTKCHNDQKSELWMLCFQVLMKHPKSTWIRLFGEHSTVISTFELTLEVFMNEVLPSLIEDDLHVDFLPFALALLEFLNTKCHHYQKPKLWMLCFQVLMKHPKSTWIRLLGEHSTVISTFELTLEVFMNEVLPSLIEDNLHVDFLPFALALLEFLNTKCHHYQKPKLWMLCFQVLMKHPQSTWISLFREHSSKVIFKFQLAIKVFMNEDLPSLIEVFKLLITLMSLPPCEKSLFLQAGIPLWFGGIIPAMMRIVVSDIDVRKIETCLTYTELLVEELLLLNYYQDPYFESLLKRIANTTAFPATIMQLLEQGKRYWHRIWIVLIKILKCELNRNIFPFASPVKSMLPVVEEAFTKELVQKIQAFACWDVLIESLYNESSNCSEDRITRMPMKLFTIDTIEAAEVKFQAWWKIIKKNRLKIQNCTNNLLIYFLHFMFGTGTRPQAAIQLSDCLRQMCINAFAEIIHVNGSNYDITNLNQLDDNFTTTFLLKEHWNDFLHALKSSIIAVAKSYTEDTKSKIQCIWISFVMRLASVAEDTLRHKMFDDLINILSELILENEMRGNEYILEIIVDDITLPLWRDNQLGTLTESRSQSHRPMHRIVKLIMGDEFNNYFKRFNTEELKRLLQPLISILLEESIATPKYIIWLLDELLVTNSTWVMWTALAQASKETTLSPEAFNKILLWPFKTVHVSFEVKEAAAAWYSLYNIVNENLEQTDFDSKIAKVLTRPEVPRPESVEDSKASNYFLLYALIGVLKHKPDEEKMAKLEALTYEMNDYNDFEPLFIPLVDTIQLMINHSTGENLAQITINCVENILKGIRSETEAIGSKSPIQDRENTFSNLRAGSDTITSTLKTYLEKCPYQSIKKHVRSLLSLPNETENPKKVLKITNPDIVPKIMKNICGIKTNSKPKTGANVSCVAKVKTPKADKLLRPGLIESRRVAVKDMISPNGSMSDLVICIPRIDEIMNRARTPVSKAQKNINFNLSTLQTPPTATDDIIVENITSCVAADDKISKDNEKARLISLKTSTNKLTSKSPEEPTTGENPSGLSQASKGVDNDAAQKETYDGKQNVQTTDLLTLNKPKGLHKSPIKRVGVQLNEIANHKKIKHRKNEDQKEISSYDENTAVKTPVIADTDLNQTKLSAKESVLLNNADKTQKKSRIEKQLAIDMVEGHPYFKTEPSKQLTCTKVLKTPKTSKKNKKKSPSVNSTIIVEDSQDKAQNVLPQNVIDEPPCSEDVIESSQDSTMMTISDKLLLLPVVVLQRLTLPITTLTQNLEDKAFPGKQNASPPRVEVTVTNSSPSPSLSLMKNQSTNNTKIDSTVEQNPSMDVIFLELVRPLPTVTCSPSGILKRKNIKIMDDSITSPAKRKRFSFRDPLVSSLVYVEKYKQIPYSPPESSTNASEKKTNERETR